MFTLHHADRFDVLLDALARVLAPAPADPFTAEVVVVPSAGVLDAAMAGLGVRHGVVANTEFVFPGALMARAFGGTPQDDPWAIDRLTWYVLEEIASVAVPGMPVPEGDDQWALARRVADLFDRYGTQRPQLVRAWASGADARGVEADGTFSLRGGVAVPGELGPAHVWQAQLWRRVRARIGVPSPPERLPDLLAQLSSGVIAPLLPERVCVFGLASLSPTMLAVLSALSVQREVHVFVQVPSPAAWGASPHRIGAGQVRGDVDVTASVAHSLLASWGRPALETRALIRAVPDVVEIDEGAAVARPHGPSVLHALQDDIRNDTAPRVRPGLDAADGTLQIHACHGETRQLEVLRDALGHLFADDPELAPRDVLVLCPDLDRFAPLITAVFSRGAMPIPVRVGDRSLTTEEPLARALLTALSLASGRAALSEMLTFVQMAPVRLARGWTIDDVERLTGWCMELGARWGLEAGFRTDWEVPAEIGNGTWRQMVDRLLAGIAMPAPTPRAVADGVAPFDHVAAEHIPLIGGLADLVARLADLHDRLQHARPIAEWVSLLHEMVDAFCDVDRDDQWRLQALHTDLDDIQRSATRHDGTPCTIPVSRADVEALLSETLGERAGRPRLRSGAVTVTSLVPQRSVPARVVCILGLDDGAVRSGVFDGDDILGHRPCVGERHPRFESRHLLLDALLAAQERLIITCNGADLTTNKTVPFVVALSELLDVVRSTVVLREDDDGAYEGAPVVIRHPRHGFDERALADGGLTTLVKGPFTFDPAMLEAALAHRAAGAGTDDGAGAPEGASPWAVTDPGPEAMQSFDIDSLVAALVNPARYYLRERLGVVLPGDAEAIDDNIPVGIDPLHYWRLGTDLLDALRSGGSAEAWRAAMRLDGNLPPGPIGDAVLERVAGEVSKMIAAALEWGIPLAGTDTVSLTVGPAAGEITGVSGHRLVVVRFTKVRDSQYLAAALRLALLQIEQPKVPWEAVLVFRPDTAKAAKSVGLRLAGGADRTASAEEFVRLATEMLSWLQRDAVPLFEKESRLIADGKWGRALGGLSGDYRDKHEQLLWGDPTYESLRNDPVLEGDPEALHDLASDDGMSRAVAVATWVWGAFARLVEQIDVQGNPVAAAAVDVTADTES